jgi:hypothetical protein
MSTFPDGLYQYGGQPVGSSLWSDPWGIAYFVDITNGNDNNSGLKPTEAKKTIAAATALCVRGDIVYIRPHSYAIGHGIERYLEDVQIGMTNTGYNLAGTTSYPLCQPSHVSLIGVANTSNPAFGVKWKYATNTCLRNDSPSLHVENIGFFAEDGSYTVNLRNNGSTDTQRGTDGTTFVNCEFKGDAPFYAAQGGDGLTLRSCRFQPKNNGTQGGFRFVCSSGSGRRLSIIDCDFLDGNGTAPTTSYIEVAAPCSEIVVKGCTFGQQPSSTVTYCDFTGACSGIIAGCFFSHDDVEPAEDIILGTNMQIVGCFDYEGLITAGGD